MAEAAVWALRSSRPLEAAGWLVDSIHTVQQIPLIEPADQRVDADLAELGSRVDALRLAFVASGSSELAHAAPLPPGRITQIDIVEPVELIVIAGGALIETLTAHSDTLRSDQVPAYAESLDALVYCLLRLDQHDAAFHALDGAVDRYRALSATDPGRYRPRLADTLRQRGLLLGPEERLPDAQEAVAIYQELCRHDPATYLPELGDAWAKVGIVYEQLVQPTETLAAYREAAACYRQLDERFAGELAQAHGSIATALWALGRFDDAATELVTALPSVEAHDPVSAVRLRLAFSHCQAVLGQDFLPDLWRAIELARQQAAGDPDATDDLAAALSMASGLLLAAGSPDEAHECAAEAVVLTRELIEQGMCNASEFADALARLARTSIMRGQLVQADELSAEAITVARPELTADPGARTLVALALGVRCAALVQLGRHAEVLDPAREAIGYLRDLVTQVPGDFGQLLEVMNLYATSLNVFHRPAEARDVLREVAGIADRLPAEFDAPFATRMATIGTLVDTLSLLGHYEEAFNSAQAAASDAVDTPFEPQCQFVLAVAEHVHGQDRATYGRYTDAEALLSACVNRLIELHAQQPQLTPFLEQRLLACGPVLGQVLRWLGRNTEAEIFEARIATITLQMELP